jgi:hypothetical protein
LGKLRNEGKQAVKLPFLEITDAYS